MKEQIHLLQTELRADLQAIAQAVETLLQRDIDKFIRFLDLLLETLP